MYLIVVNRLCSGVQHHRFVSSQVYEALCLKSEVRGAADCLMYFLKLFIF